jgi:transcriptional regulator with XRE-family HTH domain
MIHNEKKPPKIFFPGQKAVYMQDVVKKVGCRIRETRRQKGLTQEEVAEKAAVNATYYGRIERGEANVSLELLAAIAEALATTLVSLVDIDPPLSSKEMLSELTSAMETLPDTEIQRLYRVYPCLFQAGN